MMSTAILGASLVIDTTFVMELEMALTSCLYEAGGASSLCLPPHHAYTTPEPVSLDLESAQDASQAEVHGP